jgi:hypothetical protein
VEDFFRRQKLICFMGLPAHLYCVYRYYESVRIKKYRTLWSLMMHDIDLALRIRMQVGSPSILSAVNEILEWPLVEPQIGEILVPPHWDTLDETQRE